MSKAIERPTRSRALHRRDSGFVLIQVLVFSILLAMITFALVNLSISEYATANSADLGSRAFFIADAALERAVGVLRADANWNDGVGADQNASATSWQPLYDQFQAGGAGNAVGVAFPAAGGPSSGKYSISVRRPAAGSGLNPVNYIWVRALGRVGGAARSIESLVHRVTPLDFTLYVAQPLQDSLLGNIINGHGTAYFHSSISLTNVHANFYNDRALAAGDSIPYANQLYVLGTLNMNANTPDIGIASQPMYGVHATHLNVNGNLFTNQLDNIVPDVGYPNVSAYVSNLLTTQSYGNALLLSGTTMLTCTKVLGVWVSTPSPALILGPTYFVIPTKAYAACDNNVTNPANYMLIWDPSQQVPLQLNSTYQNVPILVPNAVASVPGQNIIYSGKGTIVVQNSLLAGVALDLSTSQVLASNRVTAGACGSLNPTTFPQTDILAFVVAGPVMLVGGSTACAQEQDIVLVAGSAPSNWLASIMKSQIYGMVVTESLSLAQNYEFWQVPDIWTNLPVAFTNLMNFNTTMPLVVQQWHELSN